MSSTVLIGTLLGIIAATIVLGAAWLILGAFIPDIPVIASRLWYKRKESVLERADQLIETKQIDAALKLLRKSFVLDSISGNYQAIDMAVHHNLAILSRLISVSEQTAAHLENLAVVEDLIHTRGQLLKLHVDALKTRKKKRRDVPEWAASELSKKIDDIVDTVVTNRRTLDSQLDVLFQSARSSATSAPVTYH